MGATDVLPFCTDASELNEIADLSERINRDSLFPIFLYEDRPERKNGQGS